MTTQAFRDGGAETLLVRLRGLMPTLADSERAVGRLILDHPAETARLGISELARRAGTSATTVTRFCRSMGLSGYQELRLMLAVVGYKQETSGPPADFTAEVSPDDTVPAIANKVAVASRQAIQDTLATLDLPALEKAVELLSQARTVAIYGVGTSDVVVADLHHKLTRLGLVAIACTDAHRALVCAAHLAKGDVAVGVSHSGRTAEVVEPLRIARENGAATIAVTNFPRSPLAELADIVLAAAGHSDARVSQAAQLYVTDCLSVVLAQHQGEQASAALERVDRALRAGSGSPGPTPGGAMPRRRS